VIECIDIKRFELLGVIITLKQLQIAEKDFSKGRERTVEASSPDFASFPSHNPRETIELHVGRVR